MTLTEVLQPLCVKCGIHHQSSRRAVVKGQCCNKCPHHGPWCTSRSVGHSTRVIAKCTKVRKPIEQTKAEKSCCRHMLSLVRYGAGKSCHFDFVCRGFQGRRTYMEDRFCASLNLPGHEHCALFGIFDGHGGAEVAELVAKALPRALSACLSRTNDPADALISAFQHVDIALWHSRGVLRGQHPYDWIGSTAVVVLVVREAERRLLFCANCGDSRAVLCRSGGTIGHLSVDHKPENPLERRRIEDAGGTVRRLGPCFRVDADLNLSRSFGDFAFKTKSDLAFEQQKIISVPEIREFVLEPNDDFIAIGSDGVFDAMSSETLIKHVRDALDDNKDLECVVQSALMRTTSGHDNATLCLVRLLDDSIPGLVPKMACCPGGSA